MRCKPGDLAYVVDPPHLVCVPTGERLPVMKYGTIVRVVRLKEANVIIDPTGNTLVLEFEEPVGFSVRFSTGQVYEGRIGGIGDEGLRPIRGDGITDEEVRELFAPAPKEVAHG